jgi:hypothetical protein
MLYLSMDMDYTFYGRTIGKDAWSQLVHTTSQGRCPFCGRDGLKDNFGSKRKHI